MGRLTSKEHEDIRRRRGLGVSIQDLAREYGVSDSTIRYHSSLGHEERQREWRRRSRQKNPKKYKEANRVWRDQVMADPERSERYRRRRRIYHARLDVRVSRAISRIKKDAVVKGHAPCHTDPQVIVREYTGFCSLCGRHESAVKKSLHVDHDHETGEFRGWLCGQCNKGLGMFQDNGGLLQAASEYVRRDS